MPLILLSLAAPPALILASRRSRRSLACSDARWAAAAASLELDAASAVPVMMRLLAGADESRLRREEVTLKMLGCWQLWGEG